MYKSVSMMLKDQQSPAVDNGRQAVQKMANSESSRLRRKDRDSSGMQRSGKNSCRSHWQQQQSEHDIEKSSIEIPKNVLGLSPNTKVRAKNMDHQANPAQYGVNNCNKTDKLGT